MIRMKVTQNDLLNFRQILSQSFRVMHHRVFMEPGIEHNALMSALVERSKAPFAKAAKVSNVRCENSDFIFRGV